MFPWNGGGAEKKSQGGADGRAREGVVFRAFDHSSCSRVPALAEHQAVSRTGAMHTTKQLQKCGTVTTCIAKFIADKLPRYVSDVSDNSQAGLRVTTALVGVGQRLSSKT